MMKVVCIKTCKIRDIVAFKKGEVYPMSLDNYYPESFISIMDDHGCPIKFAYYNCDVFKNFNEYFKTTSAMRDEKLESIGI